MASIPAIPQSQDVTNDAFHGTSEALADEAVKNGFTLPPANSDNRYGRGVYFWHGSRNQAVWWAKKRHPGGTIAVLRAKVAYGRHLNVISWEGQKIVESVAQRLAQRTPSPAITEAAVLNFMVGKGWIETAMVLDLPEQAVKQLFAGSYSVGGPRMILCVYSVEKILERSIVIKEAA